MRKFRKLIGIGLLAAVAAFGVPAAFADGPQESPGVTSEGPQESPGLMGPQESPGVTGPQESPGITPDVITDIITYLASWIP
jgi:hypothetical protein